LAGNVLSDSELKEQEQYWAVMDYDQLQIKQEFYTEKIYELISGYFQ